MKVAIYGASVSGYYASEILKLQGYSVMFYIDKKGKITDSRNLDDVIVYKNVYEISKESLNNIDFVMIAVGNKVESKSLQNKLSTLINKPVKTIHEELYNPIYSHLNQKKYNYLEESGFYRSINEMNSIDQNGNPIPWITYPCIEFISGRVNQNMNVFEYGSGNSTVWWSKRVNKVFAVEHDQEWFEKVVKETEGSNVQVIFKELVYDGEYSREITKYKEIDIVVIDGRDRVNCAINCINSLSKKGVIIWDNSDRESYEQGYHFLKENGFKRLDFIGMFPMYDFKSQTSIFYKNENCLGL
ncbi:hypothetical protein PGC35_01555 [Psychrobacillus sp. PGGUH221]|uniref:hypothetical protein n=1 Tax=Psychrobacillus sp. PGGUH221 TaxID=3020058 RepID=UPI0035C66711